ncbi:MAG: serine/threonine protein kinase [Planctomycetes bacterium]|nr:serine/threonine protein kinase [Planctomycetota bacterium]
MGLDDDKLYLGQILGGYRLESQVGRGGFAIVLKARRERDGAAVALKVLRSKHRGKFRAERQLLREAQILKGLRHPKIVSCIDFGRTGAWVFLAMPLIKGEVLSQTLARGPLEEGAAIDCGGQVLEALEYLHGRGLVHQDVKPDNVLRGSRGRCTLFDFGLALTREDVLIGRTGAGPGRIAGTGSYRAPEQADPKGVVGTKADIYSFGVTLHRLLTGELPEGGALSPKISAALRPLIASSLEAEPKARPSARALRRDLAAILGS